MTSILTKFYLLQYKSWKLQFRKKLVTVLEIVIPVLFCLLMVSLRTLINVTNYTEPTYFHSFSVDRLPEKLMNSLFPPSYHIPDIYKMPGLAFTPNTDQTRTIMGQTAAKMDHSPDPLLIPLSGFDTEDEMVAYLTSENKSNSIKNQRLFLGGIVFENPESYADGHPLPFNISYTIRLSYIPRTRSLTGFKLLDSWFTYALYSPFQVPGPRSKDNPYGGSPNYYYEGFLAIQRALHQSIIEYLNPNCTDELNDFTLAMERYPYPPYKDDIFLTVIQLQLPFLIILSMIFISLNIPKDIALEKEKKLKEAMRMMGMSNWLQWLAWFVKHFLFLAITTFFMALILCPPFSVPETMQVLTYSDFSLIWVFLLVYAVSIMCFCFMITVFFSRGNSAAAAGGIIFFCLYIPYSSVSQNYDNMAAGAKLGLCLDFNLAMSIGMLLIGKWEGTGLGAQWNNLHAPVTVDDNISLGQVIVMMLLDCVLYLFIMWYVEAVFPGEYGIPQPPYFFLTRSYWFGTKPEDSSKSRHRSGSFLRGFSSEQQEFFETEPVNMNAGIQITDLTKTFKAASGKKTAVNKLNLNMYEGQITALLGHNGAGKTTTMFMLTGFIPPTRGTALVNGYDIRKDIDNVRSSLGLCPQHDILFDNLTVEEHLYFFAKLKSCPKEKIEEQIDYYLQTLGIEEKRKAFAKTLSGGQKRRLSVGIALIGDSKIVILDEPTSGMDPSARRHMWDVLQSQRAGRTMILSTHFMDEADHLGDRIAILADGVVQCCGSSLFLKKKYGAGYHMVMTKMADCDVSKVTDLLHSHVPDSKLESNVGAELSYILPDDRVSAFPNLFAELEKKKEKLGITGFGASVTTMEEVFMKVGEANQIEELDKAKEDDESQNHPYTEFSAINGTSDAANRYGSFSKTHNEIEDEEPLLSDQLTHEVEKNTGWKLFAQQFKAMFYKRVIYTMRNKILTLSQIILPLVFTTATVIIIKTLPSQDGIAPKMPLNINRYGPTVEIYSSGVHPTNDSTAASNTSELASELFPGLFKSSLQTVTKVRDPRSKIVDIGKYSLKEYNFESIFAVDYNSSNSVNDSDMTVLFNAQPYHAAPLALLYADTTLLQRFVNSSYTFAAANQPLPQTTQSKILEEASSAFSASSFAYSANLMFGFSFLASSFVVFLITERSRKIKHSQIVSGVKWYNFWLSTLAWDFINYLVPALLTVILFAIAQIENYSDISNGNKQPLYLIILMVMYGLALLPNMYLLQFLFTGPATGYVAVTFFNILTGLTPVLVITILEAIESTKDTAHVLDWVFIALLPNYNMGQGMSNLYNNYEYSDFCYTKLPQSWNKTAGKQSLDEICNYFKRGNMSFPCCKDNCGTLCIEFQDNFFAWDRPGMGRSLVFLSIQVVLFWAFVILIDTDVIVKLFYKVRPKVLLTPEHNDEFVEDDDIVAEKEKVLMNSEPLDSGDSQVVISGLTKYFAQHKAVDNIHLAIPKGECFGLLGVNGAGKTTTFRMLTGDETISGGTAYMNGCNIKTDIHQVQKSIGYCPQFDALIDQMTGEEMLYMYARLRGIPEDKIPAISQDLITALMLDKHKKKLTKEYSGGNKRKLSTAIALMGDPPIVFLDEPTTGMDPVARRKLWKSLSQVRDSGKTLILTSHSMEECEALCTRMAIMVNGKYRCLGGPQHLKNKFGAGYTLIARVSYPTDGSMPNIAAVQAFVEQNFPKSVLKDKHQNLVQYHIEKGELSWAVIFKKMEEIKKVLQIEDYSVSQTTLEQVFINFARAQIPPDETKPGCGRRMGQICCVCCTPEYVVDNRMSSGPAV